MAPIAQRDTLIYGSDQVAPGFYSGQILVDDPLTLGVDAAMVVSMSLPENVEAGSGGSFNMTAVSYTHLDVYKRQADVPANSWASGYINVAVTMGIINGYPDGTFKPENPVTYAEALKMILAAIGYVPEGFTPLYWPVTWVIKAHEDVYKRQMLKRKGQNAV